MSRETIVTCDLCGQTIAIAAEQTWNVLVYATEGSGRKPNPNDHWDSPMVSVEICRPCLDRLGILVRHKKPDELKAPVPTIEDMIREIVVHSVEETR